MVPRPSSIIQILSSFKKLLTPDFLITFVPRKDAIQGCVIIHTSSSPTQNLNRNRNTVLTH